MISKIVDFSDFFSFLGTTNRLSFFSDGRMLEICLKKVNPEKIKNFWNGDLRRQVRRSLLTVSRTYAFVGRDFFPCISSVPEVLLLKINQRF